MHSTRQGPVSSKPGLELIFTGQINLADFSPPIPIPAGQRIVAKVNSGKLSGTGFSATIQGGVSVIDILNNGQAIVNSVRSFGLTSDGQPFLIEESGVGSPADDFSRAVLSVGGKYSDLPYDFLLTEAVLSPDRKTVNNANYRIVDR
ncbi:MAG: hypothetical protein L6R41_007082 [Letrouitia leprolyta]|nr:MAG: hypothetical protein L6R41_007082 [Letrouitia leprolyta]